MLQECEILLFYSFNLDRLFVITGNYKVEIFDKNIQDYVPTVQGLGMHVEIKDPDEKAVLSRVRVRHIKTVSVCCVKCILACTSV